MAQYGKILVNDQNHEKGLLDSVYEHFVVQHKKPSQEYEGSSWVFGICDSFANISLKRLKSNPDDVPVYEVGVLKMPDGISDIVEFWQS